MALLKQSNAPRHEPIDRAKLACCRESLPTTVARTMVEAIHAGHWSRDLPGERRLCEILQVSRVTLRPALQELERQGWLENTPGRRRSIKRRVSTESPPPRGGKIVLVSPLPIHGIEPFVLLGLDLLRELLARRDLLFEVETRPECFVRRPERPLEQLCRDFHPNVWLLWRSTRQIQTWFHQQRLPHVVLGTAFDPTASPSVDIDHVATARHAATTLGRLGHRRIAVIAPDSMLAGDAMSVEGFVVGAKEYKGGELRAETILHDGTPGDIFRGVDRLMDFTPRPTGIFSAGGMQTIAIMARLLQLGIRVPREISVISRDDEPSLDFFTPAPARYYRPPIKFARGVFRQIERQIAAPRKAHTTSVIFPDFLPKGTLSRH